ncbi:MAG: acylneuraminate cytidylyltransferase family protein [Chloroflexi bacterium]|nr:MAG: acylneuraminate cytidylyltransferase family protein [Chloroflexota bacterium]MBL1193089.1 acylneuraminate cytidylyltransferase family protein [Chloroflexota bacterium]NOH10382.1 acylneuraminate cytidylyltransferase family protein [Chloroflexota bacterium]
MSKVLGIIPARGGSKGIPNKNLRELAERPLLAYTVDAAQDSGVIDRLILSTDSEEIAELGRGLGVEVPFLRPTELAQDDTAMLPVLQHAVKQVEAEGWQPEIIVLLQPTAPLRKAKHIVEAVELLQKENCDSVVSVVEVPGHYLPHFVMKIEDDKLDFFLPEGERVPRRQDAPKAYSRDGSVYVFWRDLLIEKNTIYGDDCRPLILSHEHSVNLDTLEDWAEAEKMLLEKQL